MRLPAPCRSCKKVTARRHRPSFLPHLLAVFPPAAALTARSRGTSEPPWPQIDRLEGAAPGCPIPGPPRQPPSRRCPLCGRCGATEAAVVLRWGPRGWAVVSGRISPGTGPGGGCGTGRGRVGRKVSGARFCLWPFVDGSVR
jgi:hypothetical protein